MKISSTNIKPKLTAVSLALGLAFCAYASTAGWFSDEPAVKGYDFKYIQNGVKAAAPIQVFDDGKQTFLQFGRNKNADAIFVEHNGQMQLVQSSVQGPYVVIQGVYNKLSIQKNGATANVAYQGVERAGSLPQVAMQPAPQNAPKTKVRTASVIRPKIIDPSAGGRTVRTQSASLPRLSSSAYAVTVPDSDEAAVGVYGQAAPIAEYGEISPENVIRQAPTRGNYVQAPAGGVPLPVDDMVRAAGRAVPMDYGYAPAPQQTATKNAAAILFAKGQVNLGPKGRAAVDALAKEYKEKNGRNLVITVFSDDGKDESQASMRGGVIKKKLAEKGIGDVAFRYGGTASGSVLSAQASYEVASPVSFINQSTPTPTPRIAIQYEQPQARPVIPPVITQPSSEEPPQPSAAKAEPLKAKPQMASQTTTVSNKTKIELPAADALRLETELNNKLAKIQQLVVEKILPDNAGVIAIEKAKADYEAERQAIITKLETEARQKELAAEAERKRKQESERSADLQLNIGTPETVWKITHADKTLRGLFDRWAKAAGWELAWDLPNDFKINAQAEINGDMKGAINKVIGAIKSAEVPFKAEFYSGNKVIRIVTKE